MGSLSSAPYHGWVKEQRFGESGHLFQTTHEEGQSWVLNTVLFANLCIFQPPPGNTKQLSGALGQGGSSHSGRTGVRVLLPVAASVWFSHASPSARAWHLWELVQSITPPATVIALLLLLSASTPTATVSMLSTLHIHTHTCTSRIPSD